MGFFTTLLIGYIILSISLYKVFEKAGVPPVKALIPGVNFVEWCKLVGQPTWKAILILVPIVNIFFLAGLSVDLVRSFKKYSFGWAALAVVLPPVAFFILGMKPEEQYDEPIIPKEKAYMAQIQQAKESKNERQYKKLVYNNPFKKSFVREWVEAIVFAVFAAAFIRLFLIEAYVIPTPSMEGSLNVGDYLFVSKVHYGLRLPETVVMVPLLHNRVPFLNTESYLSKPSLPYKRLPGLQKLGHNDPVVFNFPGGDSVYVFPNRTWTIEDYRYGAVPAAQAQQIKNHRKKLIVRPVDKKDHYVKRCIGVAGDSLQIIDRQVYINGQKAVNPKFMQFLYLVKSNSGQLNTNRFADWGISSQDVIPMREPNTWGMFLSDEQVKKLKSMDSGIDVTHFDMNKIASNPKRLFPHDPKHFPGWTVDNYGPIYIPKKGQTVKISPENIALYERIIDAYEGNDLEYKNGKIFINGKEANEYTFKMNYYWMMGDNRHNSEDSRVWGFVPEDHIVGKPLFLFFSTKEGSMRKGINWDRIFTSADKR